MFLFTVVYYQYTQDNCIGCKDYDQWLAEDNCEMHGLPCDDPDLIYIGPKNSFNPGGNLNG